MSKFEQGDVVRQNDRSFDVEVEQVVAEREVFQGQIYDPGERLINFKTGTIVEFIAPNSHDPFTFCAKIITPGHGQRHRKNTVMTCFEFATFDRFIGKQNGLPSYCVTEDNACVAQFYPKNADGVAKVERYAFEYAKGLSEKGHTASVHIDTGENVLKEIVRFFPL